MSNEARIQISLQVRRSNLTYLSQPTAFTADVAGPGGPSPGAILVGVGRTDVSLAQITNPGLCRLQNLDATNLVEWGVYDVALNKFIAVGELLPGESYVVRLSRFLGQELVPGTGTSGGGSAATRLSLKASVAPCMVLVEAFDR
jgi:hypothetical protein